MAAPHPTEPESPLDSWKAIAGYLGTTVRTVQRWEEQSGLPVHRMVREKRASVYAYRSELDAWRAARTVAPEPKVVEEAEEVEPVVEMPAPVLRNRGMMAAAAAGLALLAGLLAVGWSRGGRPAETKLTARRLTGYPGHEAHPALSPDGKWLAWSFIGGGKSGLAVQPMEMGQRQVLLEGEAMVYSPQWSPDGKSIAFLRRAAGKSELLRYDFERRSGPVRVTDVGGHTWFDASMNGYPSLQWTPDGSAIVAVVGDEPGLAGAHVVRVDLATLTRRVVVRAPEGADFGNLALAQDGRRLAVVVRKAGVSRVHTVELDGEMRARGALREVQPQGALNGSPGWLASGDLLFLRERKQLWRAGSGGEAEAVPVAVEGEWPDTSLLVAKGDRVFWSHTKLDTAVWLVDEKTGSPVKALCDSTTRELMARSSPDGREVSFNSERDGATNIWVCDVASGVARQVSKEPRGTAWQSEWAPDGSRIAYDVGGAGWGVIRVVGRDGRALATISGGEGTKLTNPSWTADGARLFFTVASGGKFELRSARPDGSEMRQELDLGTGPVNRAYVRRDGQVWILRGGDLALVDLKTKGEQVRVRKVGTINGLDTDGLGLYFTRITTPGFSGNYTMWLAEDAGGERKLLDAVPEVMGFGPGPAGYVLAVRESGQGADLFEGVWGK